MAQIVIGMGVPTLLKQNVSYALPPKLCFITASAAIEISANESVWGALTGANTTGVLAGGTFVRCPGGDATVICKAYM